MGYDYTIQYRFGNYNRATYALSCLPEQESVTFLILSMPCLTFIEELRRQLLDHQKYQLLSQQIHACPDDHQGYSISQDLVMYKGRLWLPRGLPLISTLLTEFHATPIGGHAGVAKTIVRVSENFYWEGLHNDVAQFFAKCVDFQVTKYETKRLTGLLCPLPVPSRPWEDLSLDFIVDLPIFHGNSAPRGSRQIL